MKKVTVIGAALLDVLAGPVGKLDFSNSNPMEFIRLSPGGDALNEAIILSRLGMGVQLVSRLGKDRAGAFLLEEMKESRIDTDSIVVKEGESTPVNIALVDLQGERCFLTDPESSMRKINRKDILENSQTFGEIVSFASLFISHALDLQDMEEIFRKLKKEGKIIVVDMTTAKNGETVEDLQEVFRYIDVLVPNETELKSITGTDDVLEGMEMCMENGLNSIVVKRGSKGCIYQTSDVLGFVQAVPNIQAVDTTGAGDTFVSGFIWGLANGLGMNQCCQLACTLASFNVEKPGSIEGIPEIGRIRERYEEFYQ